MENRDRTEAWRRNDTLEGLLGELSGLLGPAEERLNALDAGAEPLPVVLVVGPPRSGTTLTMQLLAATGLCAYPTNLLSRFYAAPGIGARIQRLLLDPAMRFRDELDDLAPAPPGFDSKLGKTAGALAPNEFWYFWRRFLPTEELEWLGPRFAEVDLDGLRAELRSLTAAFDRPFACKGMMLQYDLAAFAREVPWLVFVHVERDLESNAASLLDARRSFFDDPSRWYSAKPREYAALRELPPEEQVRGQVECTNRAIAEAGEALGPERYLHLPYGDLCADPAAFFGDLRGRLVAIAPRLESILPPTYTGPLSFRATRQDRRP